LGNIRITTSTDSGIWRGWQAGERPRRRRFEVRFAVLRRRRMSDGLVRIAEPSARPSCPDRRRVWRRRSCVRPSRFLPGGRGLSM
jgi:hypothetical protein